MNAYMDDQPGRDLDSRAHLHRVVQTGAPFMRALGLLGPDAARRIGITPEKLDALNRMVNSALWGSTADLHQLGQHDFAAQVTARAEELAKATEGKHS